MPPKKKSSRSSVADGPEASPPSPAASTVKKSKAKPGTNKANGTTVGSKGKTPVVTASDAGSSASASKGSGESRTLTVQQLIGGLSWTGKLPQTLFYEHCVKAGWNNPDYYIVCSSSRVFAGTSMKISTDRVFPLLFNIIEERCHERFRIISDSDLQQSQNQPY